MPPQLSESIDDGTRSSTSRAVGTAIGHAVGRSVVQKMKHANDALEIVGYVTTRMGRVWSSAPRLPYVIEHAHAFYRHNPNIAEPISNQQLFAEIHHRGKIFIKPLTPNHIIDLPCQCFCCPRQLPWTNVWLQGPYCYAWNWVMCCCGCSTPAHVMMRASVGEDQSLYLDYTDNIHNARRLKIEMESPQDMIFDERHTICGFWHLLPFCCRKNVSLKCKIVARDIPAPAQEMMLSEANQLQAPATVPLKTALSSDPTVPLPDAVPSVHVALDPPSRI